MAKRTKAYADEAFLNSPEARGLRIMAEYIEPLERLRANNITDTIVFMGSARLLPCDIAADRLRIVESDPQHTAERLLAAQTAVQMSAYYEAARELAHRLAAWSIGETAERYLICTGGGPGIMEAANRGAAEANARNIGLTISLPFEEMDNPYISPDLHFHFHYFFMRKFWFYYLAKAVIMMPGGFGTLDELFEIATLRATKKMKKNVPIVLFGNSYWDDVLSLPNLAKYGTISLTDIDLFMRCDTVDAAFDYITRQLFEHAPPSGAVL